MRYKKNHCFTAGGEIVGALHHASVQKTGYLDDELRLRGSPSTLGARMVLCSWLQVCGIWAPAARLLSFAYALLGLGDLQHGEGLPGDHRAHGARRRSVEDSVLRPALEAACQAR